ncbi:hybrid sensor histidine kinase/response regulator [Marinilabilia sp.]|uniref:sensor histidine kinase n=1 Tax=Marinilabilia sp. TaxID=2021252 RepID=UPI0025BFF6ED|nr:hybrid sensor histidine kinase/response regulator [Marinilabilia sp.]
MILTLNNQPKKPRIHQTLCVFLLLFCVDAMWGNNPAFSTNYFDNLTRRDGLVQSNIRAISTDSKGFVWLGSSGGLYKWDGSVLSIYQNDKKDSLSLSNNNVSALQQAADSSGLWIGTVFGGLNFFDFNTAQFQSWLPVISEKQGDRFLNNIVSICEVNDTLLLLGTSLQGLLMVHLDKNKQVTSHERIITEEGEKNFSAFNCKKIDNRIYAGTTRGLFIFSEKGRLIKQIPALESGTIKEEWIKDIAQLSSGKILMATHNQLWEWQEETMTPSLFTSNPEAQQITSLTVDHNDDVWLGTINNGIFKTDASGKNIQHFTASEKDGHLLNNQINDLEFYGHQPVLFAATPAGLSTTDFQKHIFKSYDLRRLSNAQNTSVFFLMEDSLQRIWFWSLDGLFRQNATNQRFERILNTDYGKKQNIVMDGVEFNGKIFLATSNGLLETELEGGSLKWHRFSNNSVSDLRINNFSSLAITPDNRIWLTSQAGIVIFNPISGTQTIYPFPLKEWETNFVNVTDIVFTHQHKKCWIGTKSEFLIYFDTETKKFQKIPAFLENSENQRLPRSNYVLSMAAQNDDYIWLATFGSGLLQLNTRSLELSDEYAINTLSTNTYAVCSDSMNNLWISTDYGITRFSPETEEMHEFGLDEGTFCQEFNERAVHVTPEGKIMMGGINGFVFFDPTDIQLNHYIPPVYISSYYTGVPNSTIGGQIAIDVEEVTSDTIEIPYGRDNLSIEVSVLNFSHPEKNMIAWKLEGFDKEWSEASATHIISYSNLAPGKYELKVKGANNHDLWNEEGDTLHIVVTAPFYYKRWFIWAFGLFVFFLILGVFLMRMKLLKRQKVVLAGLVREKTRNLQKAIQELRESQGKVMLQNQELEIHRHDLKELVARRTADLEKAKIKAEESDRLKTAFLANLSHEIRTPMNAIVGFSTLLNNLELSENDKAEFITMIQQSGENLLALINDIIDISRIETGQMSLHHKFVKLGPFLSSIMKTLEFQPRKSYELKLILDVSESLQEVSIFTDEHRLRQVIVNLMGNALKFTSEGYIKLSVEKFSGKDLKTFIPNLEIQDPPHRVLVFIVEDTGIGISESEQKNIFQPFRKAENFSDSIYGGMGLGLSIVKSILPALGGDITLRSYPGQGTTFYFFIPYDTRGIQD